jgi:hypothetical protein
MRRKKQKKNYGAIALSAFIVSIMVMSILGYIIGDKNSSTASYKGVKFTKTSQGWRVEYEEKIYIFSFLPQDIEQIELPQIETSNLLEIDVTYDVNSSAKEGIAEATFELENILAKKNIYVRRGFTGNNSFDKPIITCDDSTQFVPVIYYTLSNETKISMEDSCIIFNGREDSSFLPLTDRLAYKILGIMS